MEQVEGNRWYINGNILTASYMDLVAKIRINKTANGVYYILDVTDKTMVNLSLGFNSLEDAFYVATHIVKKEKTLRDVYQRYRDMFYQGSFAIQNPIRLEGNQAKLSPLEVNCVIASYYQHRTTDRVGVTHGISYIDGEPKLVFKLIQHMDFGDEDKEMSYPISIEEVKEIFNDILKEKGLEVENMSYLGEEVQSSHFQNTANQSYYDGITIKVRAITPRMT